MLARVKRSASQAKGGVFAIVASSYNQQYVDAMLTEAKDRLREAHAAKILVTRVPGAYEIPLAAARIARGTRSLSAIICLGVILRGATTHAQHIAEAVTHALMQIQLESEVPIIHEVLLLENRKQAEERCLNHDHNRGIEAAETALAMARIIRKLEPDRSRLARRQRAKKTAASRTRTGGRTEAGNTESMAKAR
jgi:6,7-dimethyl-8-ribityllumazine synthase